MIKMSNCGDKKSQSECELDDGCKWENTKVFGKKTGPPKCHTVSKGTNILTIVIIASSILLIGGGVYFGFKFYEKHKANKLSSQ